MDAHLRYFRKISDLLEQVQTDEQKRIEQAVDYFVEAAKSKNSIFVFGASHSGILAEELFYRAGGLAIINPVFEPSLMLNNRPVTFTTKLERLEGFGELIAEKTPITDGDVVLCHSVSGRNPATIEFAMKAREKGAKVVAITSLQYTQSVKSRHSSGNNLKDVADLVIDNHSEKGDACIEIPNIPQKVAPTSTVIGATIVNSVVAATADKLQEQGITPPIFYSANLDGGDEHNDKIFKEYQDSIYYM